MQRSLCRHGTRGQVRTRRRRRHTLPDGHGPSPDREFMRGSGDGRIQTSQREPDIRVHADWLRAERRLLLLQHRSRLRLRVCAARVRRCALLRRSGITYKSSANICAWVDGRVRGWLGVYVCGWLGGVVFLPARVRAFVCVCACVRACVLCICGCVFVCAWELECGPMWVCGWVGMRVCVRECVWVCPRRCVCKCACAHSGMWL